MALGLIETIGLAAAVEAADAAVKSANVTLIGYELTKGDGLVTVKLEGDVGAVNAAIQSAKAAASKIGSVYSTKVIPRPANGLDMIVLSDETVGYKKPKPAKKTKAPSEKNKAEPKKDNSTPSEASSEKNEKNPEVDNPPEIMLPKKREEPEGNSKKPPGTDYTIS